MPPLIALRVSDHSEIVADSELQESSWDFHSRLREASQGIYCHQRSPQEPAIPLLEIQIKNHASFLARHPGYAGLFQACATQN
jgi:hypothetical protein